MRPGQRFGFSAIEKRDVWSRWKAGQSLHEIGRAFDKPHSCIRSVLLPRGGIPPVGCSSPFAAGAHAKLSERGGTDLTRNRFRFAASGESPTTGSRVLHREPRDF